MVFLGLMLFNIAIVAQDDRIGRIKKVVIATDADGVVFKFDYWHWAKLFMRYPHRAVPLLLNENFKRDVRMSKSSGGLYDKDGNKIIGSFATVDYLIQEYMPWANELDRQRMLSAASEVKPINPVIDLYQSQQKNVPLVVWTNNDQYTYDIKVQKINALRLKEGLQAFEPLMVSTVIATGNPGAKDKINAKPHVEYYQRVYADTCAFFGMQPGELLILFVDDDMRNILGAIDAAEQYKIPIEPIYFNGNAKTLEYSLLSRLSLWRSFFNLSALA